MADYFIGDVITHFDDWLGCATKRCKHHKKNPLVCHIKPGSKVYPTLNGLYECEECHNNKPRTLAEIYLPDDPNPYLGYSVRLSEQEVQRHQFILSRLREHNERDIRNNPEHNKSG